MIFLAILLLLLAAIPGGNGWSIPKCNKNFTDAPGVFESRFLTVCDNWQAPHMVNPFLLMVLTQSPLWAFFISGAFEIIENLVVVVMRSYVIFIGVTAVGFESIPDILLNDWLSQAAVGVILGQVFLWFFNPPRVWRGWWTDRWTFVKWLLWYLFFMAPQALFGYRLDNSYTGFPVGALVTNVLEAILVFVIVQNEPRLRFTWKGRSPEERFMFWAALYTVYFSFMLFVQFDLFYSSFVQTMIMAVAWLIFFFVCALVQGRWQNMLRWFDWGGRYLRDRAAILKARKKLGDDYVKHV